MADPQDVMPDASSSTPVAPAALLTFATLGLRIVGGLGVLLTPFFWLAGIMSLGGEGHRGRYFLVLQAFFISTMAHPLTYAAFTGLSVALGRRQRHLAAWLAQAAPVAIPVTLGVIGFNVAGL